MSNDSHTVSLEKVLAFLRDLGIDPVDARDLRSVTFDSRGVEVVRYRRNDEGQMYIVGDRVATETVLIQLDRRLPDVYAANVTRLGDAEPRHVLAGE